MLASTSEPAAASLSLPRPRIDPRLIGSLAAVYVIWSSTYLAMRVLVKTMPPLFSASLRFNIAGFVLLIIAFRRGSTWPSLRDWSRVLPIGALLFVGGNGFVSIAQLSVTSGGAAVVCASMPLWVGVLGFVTGERPSKREWISLAVGFAGIMVLMGGPSLAGEPLHLLLIIGSPISWGLGSILARRLPGPIGKDAFLLPAMEMITGGLALGVVAMLRGEQFPTHASGSDWLLLGYLLVFGSLVAFTAYNWLLRNARPIIATSYAYVNPVLAVILGAALSGEPLGATTIAASGLMVGAIWLALRRPATTP